MAITRMAMWLTVVSLAATGCISIRASVKEDASLSHHKVLRHVVLCKFKEGTTPPQIAEIERRFFELKDKIDVIECIEGGADASVEGLAQGFTHCFIVTFPDEAARDAYIPHPAHQEFVASLKPYLDKLLVVDFWAGH